MKTKLAGRTFEDESLFFLDFFSLAFYFLPAFNVPRSRLRVHLAHESIQDGSFESVSSPEYGKQLKWRRDGDIAQTAIMGYFPIDESLFLS